MAGGVCQQTAGRLCSGGSAHPGAFAVLGFCDNFPGEQDVFHYLVIEHAEADEVCAAFECVTDTFGRADGTGGEDFEGDPGYSDVLHEGDGFLGLVAEHVVVVFGVVGRIRLIHLVELPVLFGVGGPVAVVVEGLHIEVWFDSLFLAEHDGLNAVCAYAGGNVVLPYHLEGFDDIARLALVVPDVAGSAPDISG